ncbi:hypothetical protein NDU88_005162 [Pleurodeles waltl]|uniref:Uncharacterized protein n=1 Tax=Pleurodeles waltl TaxID=8319 RepID=A0AAV7VI91_PLEWA|nr:hypothetical protein NDU88_005162 [Pleurodeles waltl]
MRQGAARVPVSRSRDNNQVQDDCTPSMIRSCSKLFSGSCFTALGLSSKSNIRQRQSVRRRLRAGWLRPFEAEWACRGRRFAEVALGGPKKPANEELVWRVQ